MSVLCPNPPSDLRFEHSQCFSSVKATASLLPMLEVVLVGEEEVGSAWICEVGWCCCSEVCLVGPDLCWHERKPAELQGSENLDERKLLKLPT